MKLPQIQWSWRITVGDVAQVLLLAGAVYVGFYTIQSDSSQAKSDILMMKAQLTKNQDQITILGERTAGLQTAITFMAPQLQRIEDLVRKR